MRSQAAGGSSMHQVNLDDQVYETAQRRAAAAGFSSVDEYLTDLVVNGIDEETPDLNHLFTPERLAIIDRALAEMDAGHLYTKEESQRELAKRREEWLRKNKAGQ